DPEQPDAATAATTATRPTHSHRAEAISIRPSPLRDARNARPRQPRPRSISTAPPHLAGSQEKPFGLNSDGSRDTRDPQERRPRLSPRLLRQAEATAFGEHSRAPHSAALIDPDGPARILSPMGWDDVATSEVVDPAERAVLAALSRWTAHDDE